jgi:hypothetical protein
LNSQTKGNLVLLFILILSLCSWPVWVFGESSNVQESPENLEKELQHLLANGMAQSQISVELRRLAGLYLDLGYGFYVDSEKKLASFQDGARLAKKSLEQEEASADAHFLYAANLGQAVQLQGLVAAALNLQTLKKHVNRVLQLDGEYAPAHHILGRIFEDVPWFLGGDSEAAGEHLKKAVSLDARYAPARLDLGKWYVKHGRSQEAAKEFTRVIETPPLKKKWIWERIHRPQAQHLLQQIRDSESAGLQGEGKAM